jgi:hypothetical protein
MVKGAIRVVSIVVLPLVLVVALGGCSDELLSSVKEHVARETEPKEPVVEILHGAVVIADGSSVNFGSQPTESDTDIVFSIKNTGTGNLLLQTPVVTPSSAADGFSVLSLSGTSIAAGGSENLTIRFHPANGDTYNADVTLESNAINDSAVEFSVTGVGIPPDTDAPTGSVSINGGNSYATSTSVTLTIAATDTGGGFVQDMEVRNDTAFTGNWQAYNTSLPWTLDGPDGTDTVYIRFRDNSQNISGTYSDTIILDRVSPTISSRTPASGTANVPRTTNVTVNFSENINQATLNTSSVYLRIKGGATVSTAMSKAAASVTLNPTANLLYGYDYSIVVTSAVTDLSGRAITNPGSTDFTVERDYWEGPNGNNTPTYAWDLTDLIPRDPYDTDNWFDLVPDQQYEEWSFPTGVHSKLALLEGVDYYVVDVPAGMGYMDVRVLFTTDESHGTTVDTSGSDSLVLYVTNAGQGHGAFLAYTNSDQPYDRWYELDISGRSGEFGILIYENSSNYANRRSYNLRIRYGTGM